MNRRQLLIHLKENKCLLFREGKRHSVFHNPKGGRTSTVPRHNEIDDFLANKICKDLGISKIWASQRLKITKLGTNKSLNPVRQV